MPVAVPIPDTPQVGLIRPRSVACVVIALIVMVAAIVMRNMWFLNWVHVMSGLLWTGIDLFMGFVVGPILSQVDFPVRRAFILRLTPVTLFLFPTLSVITGTTGWFLAVYLGFVYLPWPQFGWIVAALVLISLMAVLGLGYLLPTDVRVYLELRKPEPDGQKIQRLMQRFFYVVAAEGLMQVLIIVVMAKIVTGI